MNNLSTEHLAVTTNAQNSLQHLQRGGGGKCLSCSCLRTPMVKQNNELDGLTSVLHLYVLLFGSFRFSIIVASNSSAEHIRI